MSHVIIDKQLYTQFERFAEQKNDSVQMLAERIIRDYMRQEKRTLMQQEIKAYQAMHTELLANHLGQYVAIHQGKLVDYDDEELPLYLRISKSYSDAPVLLRQVTPDVEVTITVRSPRLEHV